MNIKQYNWINNLTIVSIIFIPIVSVLVNLLSDKFEYQDSLEFVLIPFIMSWWSIESFLYSALFSFNKIILLLTLGYIGTIATSIFGNSVKVRNRSINVGLWLLVVWCVGLILGFFIAHIH